MIKTVNFGLISSKNIKDIQKKFKFREVYFNPEYILSVVNFEKNDDIDLNEDSWSLGAEDLKETKKRS